MDTSDHAHEASGGSERPGGQQVGRDGREGGTGCFLTSCPTVCLLTRLTGSQAVPCGQYSPAPLEQQDTDRPPGSPTSAFPVMQAAPRLHPSGSLPDPNCSGPENPKGPSKTNCLLPSLPGGEKSVLRDGRRRQFLESRSGGGKDPCFPLA